ncbi:MAG TPA: EAL domain-containing protein [Gaiellales bacterium]|jgi:diguanylate cyclase (GGDEF)-like protein/PAS domain S-box-containing protein|nr:EAL domain-containing protein [Gaiellales bacterium]
MRRPAGTFASRAWIAYLGLAAFASGLYLFVPGLRGSGPLFNIISGSSFVAILIGIRIHRPAALWVWRWFAIGQALFFLGDVYTYSYPQVIGHDVPFPSAGDVLYLLVYPALMTGVLLAVRRRNPQGDRAGVIDALIITVGIALLSWVFLMAPYVHDATLSPLAKSVSIAYPLGDVLLLAAALRLAFDGGRRRGSFFLLAASIGALLTTDAAYGYALLDGTYNHQLIYDIGWLVYYALWGAAALHPSMREFVEATPDRQRRLSWQRLGLLTVASLVAPGIELVREAHRGDFDLLVIVAASIVVFLLVIARVAGLVKQNERTVKRERALRLANLALVNATTPTEIGIAALDTAQLLVEGVGEVRLCVQHPAGLVLLTAPAADEVLPTSTIALLERAAENPTERVALPETAHAELRLPPGYVRANVFPLAAREDQRGLLIAAAPSPFSPILVEALDALCASVSMALESAALSEQAHRRENEARFASLVRNASDLITVVDRDGVVLYQSPSIHRILGIAADDVSGTRFEKLLLDADRRRLRKLLQTPSHGSSRSKAFDCTLIHSDGRALKFEVVATDLCDDEHVRGIVLNGRDASERAAFEEQLAHQAFHDAVTGLPNRALFSDRVEHALARATRKGTGIAVIFLDLDDFKTINDSLGHAAGDEVLQQVAVRLLEAVRETDTAARFGGDEFAILLEEVGDPAVVTEFAERLVRGFEMPISGIGKDLLVRPSIGVALSGTGEAVTPADADELIRNADAAMYICKRDGIGGYRLFEAAMHERVLERLELRAELQRAIEERQFELHFQPVVRLLDGSVAGMEALVRWHHPTRGLVQPGQFIPLAEEMGLIVELGRWVLQESCQHAARLRATGEAGPEFTIAVNLSVKQLQHPDVVADVEAALNDSGIDPQMLVLEITESVLMADYELASRRLQQLKEIGVRIAMDDFGTGYSSLSYLSRFPVDILKMDRSFLGSNASPQAEGLAAAIVALGESLKLEVVAEGIELSGQYQALRDLGCDLGQGFFIARPMDLADTREWLADADRVARRDEELDAA